MIPAARGEPLGEGGAEASPLFLELVQHALAMLKHGVADLTATRIPPGRAWEAKVIIISTEGLHNNMLNGGA